MDRVISLLAALVGLIALGGAILVHTNGDAQRNEMASQIAQLKVSMDLLTQQTGNRTAAAPAPAILPPASSIEPPISEYVAAAELSSSAELSPAVSSPAPQPLMPPTPSLASEQPSSASASSAGPDSQIAEVKALQDRISSLEQAMADQASQLEAAKAQPSAPAASETSTGDVAAVPPANGVTPAAIVSDGPTKDCIPIGTRFMATSGDNFPICKTKVVVKVAAVSDGFATINGPGDISAGATGSLAKGCNVMVFSADSTGYAEMRVTCQ